MIKKLICLHRQIPKFSYFGRDPYHAYPQDSCKYRGRFLCPHIHIWIFKQRPSTEPKTSRLRIIPYTYPSGYAQSDWSCVL